MIFALLADALTIIRFSIALVIVYLGVVEGATAFPHVVMLVVLAWVTDGLDGPLARRAKGRTRLGRFDFLIDVALTWASFAYLTLAGFIPWPLALLYTLITMVVVAYFQRKSVMIVFMRPIDLTSSLIALRYAPEITLLFLAWLVGLGLIRWRRTKARIRAWVYDLYLIIRYGQSAPHKAEQRKRTP